jgi:hypothetical protein
MRQEEPGRGRPIGPLDLLKIFPFEPAAASHRLGWVGLQAVRFRAAPASELKAVALRASVGSTEASGTIESGPRPDSADASNDVLPSSSAPSRLPRASPHACPVAGPPRAGRGDIARRETASKDRGTIAAPTTIIMMDESA